MYLEAKKSVNLPSTKMEEKRNSSPQRSNKSHRTTSSQARRVQLELEAAKARAKIELELIDKQLQADLAKIDDKVEDDRRSKHSSGTYKRRTEEAVEEWMNKSHMQTDCPNPDVPATTVPEPLLAANVLQNSHAPNPGQPVDSILLLAQTLKDMMTKSDSQNSASQLLTRLSTPRELPIFSGDCVEWLHFKSAYSESTKICKFSDSENLWRLRRALRGEAKEAVTDLLIGNTPPAQVMEALELRFGRSDLVVQQLTTQMRKLPTIPMNYQCDLFNFSIKVNNCVAAINAIGQLDYLRSPELLFAITSKLPSILLSRWMDYAYNYRETNHPKLQLLASFLKHETEIMSVVGIPSAPRDQKKNEIIIPTKKVYGKSRYTGYNNNNNNPVFATSSSETNKKNCNFCKKSSHLLTDCRIFKRALRKDRWRYAKANSLCYCCLQDRHDNNICPAPVCDIDNCGLAHHKLLHFNKPNTIHSQQTNESSEVAHVNNAATCEHREQQCGSGSGKVAGAPPPAIPPESSHNVALKVVKVRLQGPKGNVTTYALLDDGASISMIDKDLVNQLELQTIKSNTIKLIDAFGLEILQPDAPKVSVKICGFDNISYDICLRQIDKLNLPMQNLSFIKNINCNHLLDVKQFVCQQCVVPRLLIGQDNYFLLAPLEILHSNNIHEPFATRCRLGWSIHGCYGRTHSSVGRHIFHLAQSDTQVSEINELNNLLKKSYELDGIGISTLRRENTAHLRAVQILDETSRLTGKQWEVGLPFAKDTFNMPDSYNYAKSRLKGLLKKFQLDNEYAHRYGVEINKLFQQGYARELKENEISASRVWYLCHFGVQNPNKPGKLRLVFDGAGKVNNLCLNDFLLTGPDLYNSLLGIMLRFRENKYALIGDIKDMFLRIKIRPEDQNLLRFLWQPSVDAPLKLCVMQSLIFGATCSPFIAQYIRNKNALKYQDLYPEAVDVIVNNHYMDDCLHSCPTEQKTIQLIRDITYIHKEGGFEMTRWSSNSKNVLRTIAPSALASSALEFAHGATNTTERTLGLMWHPDLDTFGFKISLDRIPQNILNGSEPPTKAKMLSIIMSIFDIHGFLSPFIIQSKIIFQNVHRSGVEWNCRIQSDEHTQWMSWLRDLRHLSSLSIPRFYVNSSKWAACYPCTQCIVNPFNNIECDNIVDKQLHIFFYASTKAYAAGVLRDDGLVRGVDGRFIPPSAPEMGGSWERMIRTVKSSLKVVLKERAPHPDTLLTLLAEVEALVNSRPITHVSVDPNYPEALTPNHFLIGSSSTAPSFGKYDDSDLCLRKRWRVAQRLADMYWRRWIKEYLPTLLPRQKWNTEAEPLQVGDYVIISESNLERGCWRHGVVSATVAGSDGRVRMVDIRTRTGVLRRPVTRVALLSPRVDSAI